jgi:hypothetical protein
LLRKALACRLPAPCDFRGFEGPYESGLYADLAAKVRTAAAERSGLDTTLSGSRSSALDVRRQTRSGAERTGALLSLTRE